MESFSPPSSLGPIKCSYCNCSCSAMNRSLSGTYLRSVKRKYDEFVDVKPFTIPGLAIPQNARVEIGNECQLLRETVTSQQQKIEELFFELEEERDASSSSTSEAMSMILRLQREKAEVQMEARQFKSFVEEKMAHDQQETMYLDDLLYRKEQVIQSLTCEVEAYKHRMMSHGLTESEADGVDGDSVMSQNANMNENLDGPHYEIYPPLKVYMDDSDDDEAAADIEEYGSGETPNARVWVKDLECRIDQLEKSPRIIQPDCESKSVLEKREFMNSPKYEASFKDLSHLDLSSNLKKVDNDVSDDRVYMIDSIHKKVSTNGAMDPKASVAVGGEEYMTTQDSNPEIRMLYARLQALEADRESMRQAIISIGTDKAQLVLLKEIAQNLCKEMSPSREMVVQGQSSEKSLSCGSLFRCVHSLVSWRRKAHRSKYIFEAPAKNPGLLMLL